MTKNFQESMPRLSVKGLDVPYVEFKAFDTGVPPSILLHGDIRYRKQAAYYGR
jgi:hypothetical protein